MKNWSGQMHYDECLTLGTLIEQGVSHILNHLLIAQISEQAGVIEFTNRYIGIGINDLSVKVVTGQDWLFSSKY
ncbi:hypothetical protein K8N77_004018 [Salmonella enterica]|nr:hypothetical protein [Salmonella enterica]EIE5009736.1 hypothetical protein [Salmonella enterica]